MLILFVNAYCHTRKDNNRKIYQYNSRFSKVRVSLIKGRIDKNVILRRTNLNRNGILHSIYQSINVKCNFTGTVLCCQKCNVIGKTLDNLIEFNLMDNYYIY